MPILCRRDWQPRSNSTIITCVIYNYYYYFVDSHSLTHSHTHACNLLMHCWVRARNVGCGCADSHRFLASLVMLRNFRCMLCFICAEKEEAEARAIINNNNRRHRWRRCRWCTHLSRDDYLFGRDFAHSKWNKTKRFNMHFDASHDARTNRKKNKSPRDTSGEQNTRRLTTMLTMTMINANARSVNQSFLAIVRTLTLRRRFQFDQILFFLQNHNFNWIFLCVPFAGRGAGHRVTDPKRTIKLPSISFGRYLLRQKLII